MRFRRGRPEFQVRIEDGKWRKTGVGVETIVVIVHILVCLFLIGVILLQSGQAGDLASAFGGMGSQTAFGPRGAQTVLGKATIVCAVVFMITSITLAIMATRTRGAGINSVLSHASAPVKPGKPAKH